MRSQLEATCHAEGLIRTWCVHIQKNSIVLNPNLISRILLFLRLIALKKRTCLYPLKLVTCYLDLMAHVCFASVLALLAYSQIDLHMIICKSLLSFIKCCVYCCVVYLTRKA